MVGENCTAVAVHLQSVTSGAAAWRCPVRRAAIAVSRGEERSFLRFESNILLYCVGSLHPLASVTLINKCINKTQKYENITPYTAVHIRIGAAKKSKNIKVFALPARYLEKSKSAILFPSRANILYIIWIVIFSSSYYSLPQDFLYVSTFYCQRNSHIPHFQVVWNLYRLFNI